MAAPQAVQFIPDVRVQYGTINMIGASSVTATIAAVDITKSAVVFLGVAATGNEGTDKAIAKVVLTNTTTVTGTTNANPGSNMIISFAVLTFMNARSVQAGTITLNGVASNTATITAVNLTRSVIFPGGYTVATATDTTFWASVTLTNKTTVTATRGGTAASNTIVAYTVVEF